MHLLFGNSRFERKDIKGAIESFERAQTQIRHHASRRLGTISLVGCLPPISQREDNPHRLRQISGWQFDDLDITVQRRLCEALYEAGRAKQAEDALLKMVNSITHVTNMTEITEWISGELCAINMFLCTDLLSQVLFKGVFRLPKAAVRQPQKLTDKNKRRLRTHLCLPSAHRIPHYFWQSGPE